MPIEIVWTRPDRVEDVVEELLQDLRNGNPEPHRVLWLCPNRRLARVRAAQYAWTVAQSGAAAARMPRFATLNDLAVDAARKSGLGRALAPFEARLLVRDIVASELASGAPLLGLSAASAAALEPLAQSSLNFIREAKAHLFPRGLDAEGVVRLVLEAIGALEQDDVPRLDADRWERVRRRAAFPARVLAGYERVRRELGQFDTEDAYLAGVLPDDRYELAVFDSFLDLDEHEREYAKKLVSAFDRKRVLLVAPSFAAWKLGYDGAFERELLRPRYVETLEGVAGLGSEREAGNEEALVTLTFDVFETPATEAEAVALRVRELVAAGAEPSAIAVVYPDLSSAHPLIAAYLERAGVPFNASRGKAAAGTGLFRLFLLAFEVPLLDYDAQAVCELVDHPENRLFTEREKHGLVRQVMSRALWRGRDGLLALAAADGPAAGKVRALAEALAAIERARDPREIGAALVAFGETVGLFRPEPRDLARRTALEAVVAAIRSLERADEVTQGLARDAFADGPAFLKAMMALFESAIAEESATRPGDVAAGVQVTGILETRGDAFDYLFLAGMVDESFPGNPARDAFLPDAVRERIGLPGRADFFERKRIDFWRLARSARVGLFVSSYRLETRREHLPSRFVEELEEAVRERGSDTGFRLDRWGGRPVSAVGHRPVPPAPLAARFPARVSVSDLLDCPWRFALKLTGVRELSFPEAEPDARTIGRLFHRVVQGAVTGLAAGRASGRGEGVSREAVRDALAASVDRVVAEETGPGAFDERFARRMAGRLARISEHVVDHVTGLLASYAVFTPERPCGADVDGVRVTGHVDLLCEPADGGGRAGVPPLIVDYKVGSLRASASKRDRTQVLAYRELLASEDAAYGAARCVVVYANERGCREFAAEETARWRYPGVRGLLENLASFLESFEGGEKGYCEECGLAASCPAGEVDDR